MKRLICALMCLVMVVLSAGSLAAVDYTLPEKMQKQLAIGSGLKGSITLRGEGNSPYILALDALLDAEMQFRGMKSGEEGHYYLYQAGDAEALIGLTELYIREDGMYFRSDLLPNQVFMLPGMAATVDLLLPTEGGNPSLASAALRWLELGEQQSALLNPVVEKLESQLELWAAQFSTVSDVHVMENGQSVIDLTYAIPMSEARKEIVALMMETIADPDGQALLSALLNSEQQQVFDNANLDYFYAAALDAQDNDFDVQYTRTISTLGNQISSLLELPLDENQTGYQSLTLEENGGLTTLSLTSEDRIISLMVGSGIDLTQVDAFTCWLITRPNPAAEWAEDVSRHALQIRVSHSNTKSTDEENRDHERIIWTIEMSRDVSRLPEGENEADYPEEAPMSLHLDLHFYSRYSQNSPTTLEIAGSLQAKDFTLSIEGQMKTASPWIFAPFEIGENPIDATKLTTEERAVLLAELLASAGEQLTKTTEAVEELPEPETPTETEETPEVSETTESSAAETGETAESTETEDAKTEKAEESVDTIEPKTEESVEKEEAKEAAESEETAEEKPSDK